MAATDMSGLLREWVAKAVSDGCLRDDFGWDTRWDLRAPVFAYTVVLALKNPILGQGPIVQTFQAPISSLQEDTIREGVHELMTQLRQTRKLVLAAGTPPRRSANN